MPDLGFSIFNPIAVKKLTIIVVFNQKLRTIHHLILRLNLWYGIDLAILVGIAPMQYHACAV